MASLDFVQSPLCAKILLDCMGKTPVAIATLNGRPRVFGSTALSRSTSLFSEHLGNDTVHVCSILA